MDEARALGVTPCGLGALASPRMEKKYLLYGLDVTEQTNPIEARLGWTLRKSTRDFIGGETLRKLKAEDSERRIVLFEGEDLTPDFAIGDRVECAGGDGPVTLAAKGHFVGKSLAMGYVPAACAVDGGQAKVMGKNGEAWPVAVHLKPIYDPEGIRTRS